MEFLSELPIFEMFEQLVNFFHMVAEFFSTNTRVFMVDFLQEGIRIEYEWKNFLTGRSFEWTIHDSFFVATLQPISNFLNLLLPEYLYYYPLYISILCGTMYWFLPVVVFKFVKGVIF